MPQNNTDNHRDLLLQSIAAFFDDNGFRKTLKALQSEAKLEIDCWKSASLNLENQFYKILESSTSQTKASVDSQKDKGSTDNLKYSSEKDARKLMAPSGNGDLERLEISTDVLEETKEKKRKKKPLAVSHSENADDKSMNTGNGASESTDLNHSQKPQENKEKKKKKHELPDSSDPPTAAEDGDTGKFSEVAKDGTEELKSSSNVLFESEEKVEKKKKKRVKDSEPEPSNHASEDLHKKEKKKKSKQNLDGLSIASSDQAEEKKSDDKKKRDNANLEIGKSNPLNKNIPVADCSNDETLKSSKKRKIVVESKTDAEDSKGKSEDGTADQDNNPDKVGNSSSKNEHPAGTKKRRAENSEISNPETPVGNKAANGSTDANGSLGGTFSKSMKDEKKSTERKSSIPFQRVKVDEVTFVDERLQDNSYWAKGGADSGYGAKAQEVLGQVKGRDFRHEKTKKKRGSYRGGQIDLNTHSIKFNYSDDE